jgi:exosortase/archaeosortase family protein
MGLTLQCLALWPTGRWYLTRMADGSDEPLGILALLLALYLLFGQRHLLREQPRRAPLLAAAGLTLLQGLLADWPPLLRALLGVCALSLSLAAWLERWRETAPVGALLALSLPVVASLQFFAGYPMRLLAAEGASALLRTASLPVVAEGAGLRLNDRLVLVDAPCSGVHMLWVALVMASAASAIAGTAPARLLLNLSAAIVLVLLGNVLRNALLFVKESGLWVLPDWTHEAIGVLAFTLVLAPLAVFCFRQQPVNSSLGSPNRCGPRLAASSQTRCLWAPAVFATMCLAAAVSAIGEGRPSAEWATSDEPEWPTHFQGRALIRLPMTPKESGWLKGFPGAAARFTDGEREVLVRRVDRPTRMLHPASDCFKGIGLAVGQAEVREIDGDRWSCFTAGKGGTARQVCERIQDSGRRSWTDVSAWYWNAVLQRTAAPWWAITVAEMPAG